MLVIFKKVVREVGIRGFQKLKDDLMGKECDVVSNPLGICVDSDKI